MCKWLFVTSHRKTILTDSRSNRLYRSLAVHLPFTNERRPFERLLLAVHLKYSAVRTAKVIRSLKIFSRSNGKGHPFT